DTWEWNGATWTQRPIVGVARFGHAMAYDSARGVTVLFGGSYDDVSDRDDLWNTFEYDGNSWTQHAVAGPSQREYLAMAYDAARGRSVVFGGQSGVAFQSTGPMDDTWLWDGTSWTSKASSPDPRAFHAMDYDVARAKTVMFGGMESGHSPLGGD